MASVEMKITVGRTAWFYLLKLFAICGFKKGVYLLRNKNMFWFKVGKKYKNIVTFNDLGITWQA